MSSSAAGTATPMSSTNINLIMKDFEVVCPPDDAISCMSFSPSPIPQTNFLIAGGWDNHVRLWKIEETGNYIPQLKQSMTAPVLDVAWSDVLIIMSFLFDWSIFYCIHLIFRMEAKCLWLVVTKWPNAGI